MNKLLQCSSFGHVFPFSFSMSDFENLFTKIVCASMESFHEQTIAV